MTSQAQVHLQTGDLGALKDTSEKQIKYYGKNKLAFQYR